MFVGHFCPPWSRFGSKLQIRIQGPHWIWIQSGSGSTTLDLAHGSLPDGRGGESGALHGGMGYGSKDPNGSLVFNPWQLTRRVGWWGWSTAWAGWAFSRSSAGSESLSADRPCPRTPCQPTSCPCTRCHNFLYFVSWSQEPQRIQISARPTVYPDSGYLTNP